MSNQPINTSIRIRVQARGGKYLGPGVKYSQVSVMSGTTCLWSGTASGNSGLIDTRPNAGLDPRQSRAIVPVTFNFGVTTPLGGYALLEGSIGGEETAGVIATVPISEPQLLEIRVVALQGTPNEVTASVMTWVVPGIDLVHEPGVLVLLPGLVVSAKSSTPSSGTVTVTATVTMMCGCPITEYTGTWPPSPSAPEPYWPASEFEVVAMLTPASGPTLLQPLKYSAENTFTGTITAPAAGDTLAVYALQRAESNIGYAVVS